jgi:hypothetical protein
MTRTTHMFRRSVVAVAAVALLTAPGALAGGASQYGPHDPWYAYATSQSAAPAQQPDPWIRYAVAFTSRARSAQHAGLVFTTDTLGGNGHSTPAPVVRFTTDTLGGNGQPTRAPVVRFVTDTLAPGGGTMVVASGEGFDWSDAGIGAGAAIVAVLLASVAGGAVLHRRGRLAL